MTPHSHTLCQTHKFSPRPSSQQTENLHNFQNRRNWNLQARRNRDVLLQHSRTPLWNEYAREKCSRKIYDACLRGLCRA